MDDPLSPSPSADMTSPINFEFKIQIPQSTNWGRIQMTRKGGRGYNKLRVKGAGLVLVRCNKNNASTREIQKQKMASCTSLDGLAEYLRELVHNTCIQVCMELSAADVCCYFRRRKGRSEGSRTLGGKTSSRFRHHCLGVGVCENSRFPVHM